MNSGAMIQHLFLQGRVRSTDQPADQIGGESKFGNGSEHEDSILFVSNCLLQNKVYETSTQFYETLDLGCVVAVLCIMTTTSLKKCEHDAFMYILIGQTCSQAKAIDVFLNLHTL